VSRESLTATELDPSKHLHQKTALRGFEVFQAIKNIRSEATWKDSCKHIKSGPVNCLPISFDTFQTQLVYSSSIH
jgi:hypothetical protein